MYIHFQVFNEQYKHLRFTCLVHPLYFNGNTPRALPIMLMLFLPGSHPKKPGHCKEAFKTQKPDPSPSGQARARSSLTVHSTSGRNMVIGPSRSGRRGGLFIHLLAVLFISYARTILSAVSKRSSLSFDLRCFSTRGISE